MARPSIAALSSWALCAFAVALSLFTGRASAEETPELCACSPSKITFTLDFSLTCPPVNVTINDGIAAKFCQISPFGDANETIVDLVPAAVQNIDVIELDQNFQVIANPNPTNLTGPFENGHEFEYTSAVTENPEHIPGVLQVNIFASNAGGEPIVGFFAISFTNDCTVYPALSEGGSAGWTHFTKVEPPSTEDCPAYVPPTEPPIEPTESPTESAPVDPTEPPVEPSTDSPTESAPVDPTEPPVEPATGSPTESAPVDPTEPPAEPSTDSPTESQTTTYPTTAFPTTMSMADVEDIITGGMSMSMGAAVRSAFGRIAEIKSGKSAKKTKYDKAKYEKKEKSEKSDKSDKKDKSEKKDKSDKSDRRDKKSKKEKRRRLRLPVEVL